MLVFVSSLIDEARGIRVEIPPTSITPKANPTKKLVLGV